MISLLGRVLLKSYRLEAVSSGKDSKEVASRKVIQCLLNRLIDSISVKDKQCSTGHRTFVGESYPSHLENNDVLHSKLTVLPFYTFIHEIPFEVNYNKIFCT